MAKLTKAQQTQQTRRAILDRARLLFAEQGFAATGTEEMIQGLGITRGALYHQFKGKSAVFEAVVGEAYREMTDHISQQIQPIEDPWEQLVAGCLAFLEVAQREDLRRLIFVEAPAVLPAETLVEFDQYGFGLLQDSIYGLVDAGQLATIDAEGFSHLVNGALNELVAWVAQGDGAGRLETAQKLVENLLTQYRAE